MSQEHRERGDGLFRRRDPSVGRERPAYDYLLLAGPGRSGSTFLYQILNGHATFAAPVIKEGYLYRSPARFERAMRRLRRAAQPPTILLDAANLAWCDPRLAGGLEALRSRGYATLVVLLLRDHRERAVSMMTFRRSRGEWTAFLGRRVLERAVVRDSLTASDLSRFFGLGADVLTIGFSALTADTARVLDVLADLCGVAKFKNTRYRRVNESVGARNLLLSASGKLAAVALRRAGCLGLLQRLKDSARVQRIFFRPGVGRRTRLGAEAETVLARHFEACQRAVDEAGERLMDGVWLRRATAGPLDGDAERIQDVPANQRLAVQEGEPREKPEIPAPNKGISTRGLE